MPDATFLFTDVERSTELACGLADRYIELLVRHRDVLREAVAEAGGRTLDCRGDETFASFDNPTAAVSAAIRAQRELASDPALAAAGLRVRTNTSDPQLVDSEQPFAPVRPGS